MSNRSFNPMTFLSALGAGGIAVAPFGFFQYAVKHPNGLVLREHLNHGNLPVSTEILYSSLEAVMVIFAILHFALMGWLGIKLFNWIREGGHREMIKNPVANSVVLTPILALSMTFNLFIGTIRFFSPVIHENLQSLMLPAFVAWVGVLFLLTWLVNKLLKSAFLNEFDINQIHFGWMLYPFTIAMHAVVGTGIAAMAKDPQVAGAAAILTAGELAVAGFLFLLKLFAVFQSHYTRAGLPSKQFLPGILGVVPVLTLFGISGYRLAHYLHAQHGVHSEWMGMVALTVTFGFQVWYLIFALNLMSQYLKRDFFKSEYYVQQWALVCPFVALSVFSVFVYFAIAQIAILLFVSAGALFVGISIYAVVFVRMLRCAGIVSVSTRAGLECA